MLFLVLFLGILFIPGYLISGLIRTRENRFLVSITLSYFYFIVLLSFDMMMPTAAGNMAVTYMIIITLLLLGNRYFHRRKTRSEFVQKSSHSASLFSATLSPVTVALIILSGGVYHWVFGIYDEVPSDLYQHLEYATTIYRKYSGSGLSGNFDSLQGRHLYKKFWYFLVAWVAHISGTELIESFPYVIISCSLIFMVAVASIADRIFLPFLFSHLKHQLAILLTVFFVFAQMGINVFSFVRYYSYAPTMINFAIYFTGLVCALNLFEKADDRIRSGFVLLIAIIVGFLVHMQEALFILIACGLLLIWRILETLWQKRNLELSNRIWPIIGLITLIVTCLAFYAWIRFNYNIRPFYHEKVIPLPFSVPLLGQLYVLDPSYQFFRVVTIWGLFVYALFFINFKYFCKQPFLVMAMLSPVLTVFNPFFTDVFLHMDKSITLWRLCFFIPIHFVAGVSMLLLLDQIRSTAISKRVLSGISIGLLFVFLLPTLAFVPLNSYAKTTLAKVEAENGLAYWRDVVDYLSGSKQKYRVLTDPITGYLLEALTLHKANHYKFLPDRKYYANTFVFDNYDNFPLAKYSGSLILVNTRDGGESRTGELSGHWHKNVLSVSEYYPENLRQHLEAYPDRFEKRWSNDRITVYYIQ